MKKLKSFLTPFAMLLLICGGGVTFIGCSTYDDKSTDGGSTGGNSNITVSVVNAPEDIGTLTNGPEVLKLPFSLFIANI